MIQISKMVAIRVPMPGSLLKPSLLIVAAVLTAITSAACSSVETRKQRHLERGDAYVAEGKFQEAAIEYGNAVQLDAKFAQARAKLAVAYEKAGDGSNALNEYIRAADLLPDDVELQLTTAKYLMASRRLDEALARTDAVLKLQPNNVDAHIIRGNALGGLNDLEKALGEMEEALRLDPARGTTYTHLGIVESARGKMPEAEAAFKRAVELAPDSVSCHLALANFYWASGRMAESERSISTAIKLDPKNQNANHAMAIFSLATGRVGDAEKYLKQLSSLAQTPTSLFDLAEYYIATRRSAEAIAILEPMAADPRTSSGAKRRLVRAYVGAGDPKKAHTLIDEILAQYPRDAETQLLKGQLLLDEGRRDQALESVKAAVAADPTSLGAHYTLGRVYAARGDFSGAEAAYSEVLKLNPSASAARVELSILQLSTGEATESLRSAEEAVKSQPRRVDVRLSLVRSLLAAKEFDRAQREIQELLAARPDMAVIHVQNGVLAASRNNTVGARAAFEKALELDPGSIEALGGLLALELNAKDFAAAKARLTRRIDAGPVTPALLLLAARTYGSINDMKSAEETLRRVITEDPTVLTAYSMLGQIYLRANRLDEAQKEFENLAQRQSNPVGALTMSGMIFQAQGNTAEARLRFERAVAIDPRAAVAANNLAWLYAESGEKLEEALLLARRALEVLPNSLEILDTVGWVYYKSDLASLAVQPLSKCAERDPKNATCRYHLGLTYAKLGDSARAREALTKAVALNANAAWIEDARRALSKLGQSTS